MDDDWTLEAMERRESLARGRPLSDSERAEVKQQADRIAALQKELEEAKQAEETATLDAEVRRIYEATLKDLEGDKTEVRVPKPPPLWLSYLVIFAPVFIILLALLLAGYGVFRLIRAIL